MFMALHVLELGSFFVLHKWRHRESANTWTENVHSKETSWHVPKMIIRNYGERGRFSYKETNILVKLVQVFTIRSIIELNKSDDFEQKSS